MKEFNFVIKDELGIHARPAGMLVKEAGKFESAITVNCKGKSVGAKKLLGIMGMAIKKDDEVNVTVEGADEEEACAAILKFFEENL